ncbi:MAG: hypothetical protein ABSD76_07800 [Terriglobales bacterium]
MNITIDHNGQTWKFTGVSYDCGAMDFFAPGKHAYWQMQGKCEDVAHLCCQSGAVHVGRLLKARKNADL